MGEQDVRREEGAAAQPEATAFSNGIRLNGRQWLGLGLFAIVLLALAPLLGRRAEKFALEPDYRIPHELSNDYWLYECFAGLAADHYDTILLGDSVVWGAIVSGTKRFADGNRIGLGVGVYDRIEKTVALPFLIVDWRLGDRWRIINPLAAGPTGPAGLELDYLLGGGWTVGLGGAFRTTRFRLSENGPVRNGVGQESGLPIFLRATYAIRDQMALHLYAGVVTAGELRVDDSSGNNVRKVDFDPAPFFAVTFTGRF